MHRTCPLTQVCKKYTRVRIRLTNLQKKREHRQPFQSIIGGSCDVFAVGYFAAFIVPKIYNASLYIMYSVLKFRVVARFDTFDYDCDGTKKTIVRCRGSKQGVNCQPNVQ